MYVINIINPDLCSGYINSRGFNVPRESAHKYKYKKDAVRVKQEWLRVHPGWLAVIERWD